MECLCFSCEFCEGTGVRVTRKNPDGFKCPNCEGTGRIAPANGCEAHSEQMELEPIEGCTCRPGPGFCPTCKAILDAPVYGEKEMAA